jgi:hypothetical protein
VLISGHMEEMQGNDETGRDPSDKVSVRDQSLSEPERGVVHEPDRPWPMKSKGFCISRGAMQNILHKCKRFCASEQFGGRAVFSGLCAERECRPSDVGFQ